MGIRSCNGSSSSTSSSSVNTHTTSSLFSSKNNSHHRNHAKSSGSSTFINSVLKVALSSIVTLYILNQKHLLPKPLSSVVSKTLFWPTLPISMIKRIGTWSNTQIDDTVLMGGAPFSFLDIPNKLYEQYNVRAVINLCEEYNGPTKVYETLGIVQLKLPTTDHFEPSFEDLVKAVQFIQDYKDCNEKKKKNACEDDTNNYYFQEEKKETDPLQQSPSTRDGDGAGGRVYVHCRAGHGRSAAVVYAWLLSQQKDISNVNLQSLNEQLSSKRNVRKTLWKQPNINKFYKKLYLKAKQQQE